MTFSEKILERAKSNLKTIVLPESEDMRILEAAAIIQEQGIANIILIGDRHDIQTRAKSKNLDISGVKIVDHMTSGNFERYADMFYELRKNKGATLEQARELMADPLHYGVMMVKDAKADGMVAGSISATADTLRPALRILKSENEDDMASAFFVMVVPNCDYGYKGIFIFADSGLVENPSAQQMAQIAITSAESFKLLVEEEPKVAMLSYSTHGSAKGELVEKVVKATQIAKGKAANLLIDGELQLDAAIVPKVSRMKAPTSELNGEANVLIFPDLNCGNIGYKLVQRLANAEAYGPITQGLLRPVNDLSRGCSVNDIVGVVAITAVQAQKNSRN